MAISDCKQMESIIKKKKHISTQTHTFTIFLKYRVLEVQVFGVASYRHPGQKGQNIIVCLQTNRKILDFIVFGK